MPAWQQHLHKAKGGPWKPRYPSMRKARRFSDFQRERLSVTPAVRPTHAASPALRCRGN